ncbi:uncharacterized protein MELLADRAFT_92874 [Melampsora larici-populina 98AG31]|uniref:Uncharacterized protein n=1 Tax=Melampsora larici-populina (strain 98AG31 / pathotype 3-4-7) TaxID=747676 RepID=F4S333_MELLP|nr:uncharacterized protein MELLADRAFT_92874 [Melampsora larici-populina 98AG31]EGG00975.1 hypothetical protein MELLADRAFT_92874 [Melampsora larici-populina 98AG31]
MSRSIQSRRLEFQTNQETSQLEPTLLIPSNLKYSTQILRALAIRPDNLAEFDSKVHNL